MALTKSQERARDAVLEAVGSAKDFPYVDRIDDDGVLHLEWLSGGPHYTIGRRGGVTEISAAPGNVSPAAEKGGGDSREHASPSPAPLAVAEDTEPFAAMSAADDRQIAADIQGSAVRTMIYSYRQKGQQITDPSWKGWQEMVRISNTRGYTAIGIATDVPPDWHETTITVEGKDGPEERPAIAVTVVARDEKRGKTVGQYGTAVQPLEQRRKDGSFVADPFARQKALSKAQRNAMRGFIPLEVVEELKQLYLDGGQVEYIKGTGREMPPAEPALDTPEAQALIDKADALYAEFKKADEHALQKLPPAKYHAYKSSAWHSIDRLKDFVNFLSQMGEEGGAKVPA